MHICYCHAILLPLLQLFLQPPLRKSLQKLLLCSSSQDVSSRTQGDITV